MYFTNKLYVNDTRIEIFYDPTYYFQKSLLLRQVPERKRVFYPKRGYNNRGFTEFSMGIKGNPKELPG